MNPVEDFISLFFPRYCLGCGRCMVKGEEILCTLCISDLPRTEYHLLAGNPIEIRLRGRLPVQYGWAFLKFRKDGIVQHLLHELKYNNHPEIGVALGRIFGYEIKVSRLEIEFDLIIPVPLHQARKRRRGYNQSAAFAEGLSFSLGIPWTETITVRQQNTASQTKKNRSERWENVKDVFSVSSESVKGKRILLVDDVITTGATLEACGAHIVKNGCASLSIACIAEAQ